MTCHCSEVARLREQIELEYESARLALYGLASGTARHEIINAHMANAQQYGQQLINTIGADEAMPIIVDAINTGHDHAEAAHQAARSK